MLKRRAPDLENQESIKVKEGFNLLQISPNWTPDPCIKWALAKELNSLLTQYGVSGVDM